MLHKTKKGHRYSYSGADAKVWMYYGNDIAKESFVESLQTISFSVHEPRGRVRALGYKGVKGFTRSVREIAGTMIFTVIEDHPLAHLLVGYDPTWSLDQNTSGVGNIFGAATTGSNRRIATTIPPFNLSMIYATEMASSTSLIADTSKEFKEAHTFKRNADGSPSVHATGSYRELGDGEGGVLPGERWVEDANSHTYYPFTPAPLKKDSVIDEFKMDATIKRSRSFNVAGLSLTGIEIITEGIVTSVNDMITEIQVQFLAKDYKEIGLGHYKLENVNLNDSEALEFAKQFYKSTSQWQEYESQQIAWEKNIEKEMNSTWDTMESRNLSDLQALYPGARIKINPITGRPEAPDLNIVNSPGFQYDPNTGTFTSTMATINNPILFINEED